MSLTLLKPYFMSVAELKQKLIEKISKTDDIETLEEISSWIYLNENPPIVYNFTEEQLAKLEVSEQQIKDGNFFTNEEVNKETEKWLGE